MATAAPIKTDDKPQTKRLRDGVLVQFKHMYGVWQPGDTALFDEDDAKRMCGVTSASPLGSERAVAAMIGFNASGTHHKATRFEQIQK
jgi:hypothetical protein